MTGKIRAVLFDLGRVIVNFDHAQICHGLARFCPYQAAEVHHIIFDGGLERQYDEGKLTSTEFYAEVLRRLHAEHLSYAEFATIWGDIFTLNADIFSLIPRLDPQVKRLLISNTNEIHWQYIRKFAPIVQYFSDPQQWVLSFAVQTRKPDTRIYTEAIRRAGVAAREILYLDDIPAYAEAFRALQGQAIVYDCRFHSREYLEKLLLEWDVPGGRKDL
jgi:FMN phosphatase YigB (HAD superfamily)